MGPVTATITIDAPRERVFAEIADLAKRPAFCDHFLTGFHLQRIESRGVGAAARFHADAKRFPIWMESRIVEQDAPHRLLEKGKGSRQDRMVVGTAWELVEGSSPSTTEVSVTFWGEPENPFDKGMAKLGAAAWYRRGWKKALQRLRDAIEADQPLERIEVAGASRL